MEGGTKTFLQTSRNCLCGLRQHSLVKPHTEVQYSVILALWQFVNDYFQSYFCRGVRLPFVAKQFFV